MSGDRASERARLQNAACMAQYHGWTPSQLPPKNSERFTALVRLRARRNSGRGLHQINYASVTQHKSNWLLTSKLWAEIPPDAPLCERSSAGEQVSHTHQVAGAAPAAHTTHMLPQLNVSSSSLRTSRLQAKILSGVPFTPREVPRRVICWVTAELAHRPRLQHCPPQFRSRQEFAHSNLAACICHTGFSRRWYNSPSVRRIRPATRLGIVHKFSYSITKTHGITSCPHLYIAGRDTLSAP